MNSHTLLLLALGSWLVCGCAESPQPVAPAQTSSTDATSTNMPPEPPADPLPQETPAVSDPETTEPAPQTVEMHLMDWSGVEDLIASHAGRVVVVDLWATYCAPCRKEFPGLIALSHEHPDSVACISVSLDDIDDQEDAMEFLQEQNATIDNVLCTTDQDTLYDEILRIGAIPAIYVYGPNGDLIRRFVGPAEDGSEHTYEGHVVPFVEEVLGAG